MLDALQELTRLAVLRETGERCRLMLDIAGYRAAAPERAHRAGHQGAAGRQGHAASRSGCAPMTPFERKVVHDAVAAAGLASESEGEEPRRVRRRPARG